MFGGSRNVCMGDTPKNDIYEQLYMATWKKRHIKQYMGLTHTHQLELFYGGRANQYPHYYNLGIVYFMTVGACRFLIPTNMPTTNRMDIHAHQNTHSERNRILQKLRMPPNIPTTPCNILPRNENITTHELNY